MKKRAKLKGFTLVELLIVIVVIGVLSARMMLSSTEAVTSAKAADIISDLRNCKTAALAWYADNLLEGRVKHGSKQFPSNNSTGLFPEGVNIAKYMNGENKITYDKNTKGKYSFSGKEEGTWIVCLQIDDKKVFDKLKSRGKSVGLKWVKWTGSNANYIDESADIADKEWEAKINVGFAYSLNKIL